MILHNLSFETVCRNCCKDNPDARVPQSIMQSINAGLQDKIKSNAVYELEKRSEGYWVCVRSRGAIPRMLVCT
jgi:DNA polymerase elongation subunit (family B)